jgi:hypothetical protein
MEISWRSAEFDAFAIRGARNERMRQSGCFFQLHVSVTGEGLGSGERWQMYESKVCRTRCIVKS